MKKGRNCGMYIEHDNISETLKDLVVQETALVRRWKRLFISISSVGALFVSAGAYILLSREEEANYKGAVRSPLIDVDTEGR
jgi:hypothetical protein